MNEKDLAIYYLDQILRNPDLSISSTKDFQKALEAHNLYKDLESVKKYLKTMKADGAPITKTKNRYKYKDSDYVHPYAQLSPEDYFHFSLTLSGLEVYKNTPLWEDTKALMKKFTPHEPTDTTEQWLNEHISILPESWISIDKHTWNLLLEALKKKLHLQVKYQKTESTAPKEFIIEPYHIYFAKGNWYLAGYYIKKSSFMVLALNRIRQVELMKETFLPRSFNFKEFIGGSSYGFFSGSQSSFLVKVKVNKSMASWITERTWNSNQSVESINDQYSLLSFTAVNDWEVKNLIHSWGPAVELLEPKSLREELKKELHAAYSQYAND